MPISKSSPNLQRIFVMYLEVRQPTTQARLQWIVIPPIPSIVNGQSTGLEYRANRAGIFFRAQGSPSRRTQWSFSMASSDDPTGSQKLNGMITSYATQGYELYAIHTWEIDVVNAVKFVLDTKTPWPLINKAKALCRKDGLEFR